MSDVAVARWKRPPPEISQNTPMRRGEHRCHPEDVAPFDGADTGGSRQLLVGVRSTPLLSLLRSCWLSPRSYF
jgi:hypothetical protein